MRGKAGEAWQENNQSRITPAYAGKSLVVKSNVLVARDHPRLCGEKVSVSAVDTTPQGSPPPMRGKAFAPSGILTMTRITPAYAGKRLFASTSSTTSRDHPRLCGEKGIEKKLHICFMGSPPPMRGKAKDCRPPAEIIRITPAYAGKSILLRNRQSFLGDHPRLCGEKNTRPWIPEAPRGSPPPMRGKAKAYDGTLPEPRITPAYAGKRHGTNRRNKR